MGSHFASDLLGIIISVGTVFGAVYSFFKWLFRMQSSRWLVAIFAAAATTVGGILWNLLCHVMVWMGHCEWHYYMGGSGNEPHEMHAFIWGALTLTPVALFAILFTQREKIPDWPAVLKWLGAKYLLCVSLYGVLGGLGAHLFYDSGLRPRIEAAKLGGDQQELIIVVLWAGILSAVTYLALPGSWLVLRKPEMPFRSMLQIPFAVYLSFFSILFFLSVFDFTPRFDILRGLVAGCALRLGLYCGLIAAPLIHAKELQPTSK
ncbi:MAG: hypothetical protein ABR912_08425 [Terracidiphilus sp.]|jgi:hypothetical protein